MNSREKRRRVLERLPPTFREQYFSIFSGPEPETLHPDLYQRLIDEGTDMIIEHLKEYNKLRKSLVRKVLESVKIHKLRRDDEAASMRVVASDAGNNGVDLRSAFAPLYASTALAADGWKITEEPIFDAGTAEIWSDESRVRDREALLASKIQFKVTEEAVERWNPKMVIFDGTLLINFWLLPSDASTEGYRRDFDLAVTKAVGLLHTCYEWDIPVVGFVKRTRMSYVCKKFGIHKMRDTALFDLALRLGEYTVPYPEPMSGRVVNRYRSKAKELGIPERTIKKLTSFYSSYIRTGLTTPFRLEIPEYCIDRLEEIGTVVFTTSEEESGIPFSINEADRLTRVTTSISNIRTLMLYSKALDLVKKGEMEPEDLNLLALQHGEHWVIRDGQYLSDVIAEGGGA
ncbi:MAG: DNA double-strand break repair nuclease NurA [Candidatus Bathyarchaeia archaeon]